MRSTRGEKDRPKEQGLARETLATRKKRFMSSRPQKGKKPLLGSGQRKSGNAVTRNCARFARETPLARARGNGFQAATEEKGELRAGEREGNLFMSVEKNVFHSTETRGEGVRQLARERKGQGYTPRTREERPSSICFLRRSYRRVERKGGSLRRGGKKSIASSLCIMVQKSRRPLSSALDPSSQKKDGLSAGQREEKEGSREAPRRRKAESTATQEKKGSRGFRGKEKAQGREEGRSAGRYRRAPSDLSKERRRRGGHAGPSRGEGKKGSGLEKGFR